MTIFVTGKKLGNNIVHIRGSYEIPDESCLKYGTLKETAVSKECLKAVDNGSLLARLEISPIKIGYYSEEVERDLEPLMAPLFFKV